MTPFLALIGGLGWPELLLIGVVVLLVFGPRRLPEIAESLGASIKKFRKATQDVQDEVKRELDAAPRSEKTNRNETTDRDEETQKKD